MRSFALPSALVFALTAGCAHADAQPAAVSPAPAAPIAPPQDGLWQKLDPRLRAQVADKTIRSLRAIARLRAPLAPAARAELAARGLRFLSLQSDYAHVEGDAEALLRLAARDEVTRLGASGPVEKSRGSAPEEAP